MEGGSAGCVNEEERVAEVTRIVPVNHSFAGDLIKPFPQVICLKSPRRAICRNRSAGDLPKKGKAVRRPVQRFFRNVQVFRKAQRLFRDAQLIQVKTDFTRSNRFSLTSLLWSGLKFLDSLRAEICFFSSSLSLVGMKTWIRTY